MEMRIATLEQILDNFMIGHSNVVMVDASEVTGFFKFLQSSV